MQLSECCKEKLNTRKGHAQWTMSSRSGKSNKPLLGMFVTNHFNKIKEKTRYIQPSIMQHKITFTGEFYHPNFILYSTKFKCGGWSSLKHFMPCC